MVLDEVNSAMISAPAPANVMSVSDTMHAHCSMNIVGDLYDGMLLGRLISQ